MADVLSGLRAFPRILLEHWPALVAWYLAGGVVRLGIMYLAAPLSRDQPVLALLFLPLAVLARLIAYVAMFLTVRRSMPAYRDAVGEQPTRGARETVVRFTRLLFPAVAPFFIVYGLVGGVEDDLTTYAHIAYSYNGPLSPNGTGLSIGSGPVVVAIIVVAFLARQLLGRFGDRLHESVVVVEIYLEATWTFVAVTGIANVLGGVITWIHDREVVALLTDTREALVGLWHGFEYAFEGVDGLVPILGQFLLYPMLWIFVAALVYAQSVPDVKRTRVIPAGIEIRARARLSLMPGWLSRWLRGPTEDWADVYKPAVIAVRMIRGMGLPALEIALTAFGLLYGLQQWGLRWVVLALGPHEVDFWEGAVQVIDIAVLSLVEPVRIALLSSVFDGMLGAWRRRTAPLGAEAPLAQPAVSE